MAAGHRCTVVTNAQAQVTLTSRASNHFELRMSTLDAFATFKPISIRIVVDTIALEDGQSKIQIMLSLQPAEHPIWKSLQAALNNIQNELPRPSE